MTVLLTIQARDDDGRVVGSWLLHRHAFKSGRLGWLGLGKIDIDGQRYQCQAQVVKIGPVTSGDVEQA